MFHSEVKKKFWGEGTYDPSTLAEESGRGFEAQQSVQF